MIIGISGKAQSGKDTLCKYLQSELAKRAIPSQRLAFADELKRVIGKELFDLSHDQMYTSEGKEEIDLRYDLTPRDILQRGGDIGRNLYPDIWAESALRQATNPVTTYIITDMRFENEWALVTQHDGYTVRLERPSVIIPQGADHASEVGLDHIPPKVWDAIYLNEKSLADLARFATSLVERWS